MSDSDRIPVIISAARLPTGRFMGGLSSLAAPDLGALAISAAVDRAGVDPDEIDDVIMGNVVQAGVGQAPARQAAIRGGVPVTVPAVTVNKVCGSGLKAVMLAAQAIKAGDARVVVAGGMESMSNAPYLLRGHREGVKFGDRSLVDGLIHDGLWCAFGTCHMGGHAEYTAHKAGVSRADQDAYALGSHDKAIHAIDAGEFAAEVVPVHVETRRGTVTIETDEPPRRGTSLEALGKLRPAFAGDAPPEVTEPSVTAGNAPGLNDGGAATVVASEAYATAHGLPILARIRAYSVGATAPRDLFFAPVAAVRKLMTLDGTVVADYGLVEMNEAFAVQCLADARELGLDLDRVNVRGGAIALGHPIGASGAKILTTLLHAMRDRDVERGMATLCLGGGNAVAMSVERR
ncbi:MAG: acetyl-CoA C-acyltransferase [Gemmatimonadetes bacterium]|nr:acetyl-CoA C-acyltransferase [Candidatus Palauibacter rhopaloidicola]